MSDCGNCDCADKTKCVKKGNGYGFVIETENSYDETFEVVASGETDGKCKCGPNCTCTTCTCGHFM